MRRTKLIAGVVLSFLWISQAFGGNHIPLPDDVEIFPPEQNVPANFARFSGKWSGGEWSGNLPGLIIIEEIDKEGKVVAIYAWGDHPTDSRIKKGWTRTEGIIKDGHLVLKKFEHNGAEASYSLALDGALLGTYTQNNGRVSRIRLSKQN